METKLTIGALSILCFDVIMLSQAVPMHISSTDPYSQFFFLRSDNHLLQTFII
jgi:hypothetical protein